MSAGRYSACNSVASMSSRCADAIVIASATDRRAMCVARYCGCSVVGGVDLEADEQDVGDEVGAEH